MLLKVLYKEMFGDYHNIKSYITLDALGTMVSGGTPSRKNKDYYGGTIPFVTTPSLCSDYIDEKNAQDFLTEEGVNNSATHKIPKNSLLIGVRVGVGKCAINTCEVCTNQDIVSFTNITPKFDLLFLKKTVDLHASILEKQKRGATIQGVTSREIKALKIPNVPLDKQIKYSQITKQFDKVKATLQAMLEKLELLKKAKFKEMFGEKSSINLDKIATITMGQSPLSEFVNTNAEGLPFYQGKTEFTESLVGPARAWCSNSLRTANKGDILISVRAPVGDVNIATEKCCIGRGLAAIHPNDITYSEFLFEAIRQQKNRIEYQGTGSTFKAINKEIVHSISIPKVSIQEAVYFKKFYSHIETLKNNLKNALSNLTGKS